MKMGKGLNRPAPELAAPDVMTSAAWRARRELGWYASASASSRRAPVVSFVCARRTASPAGAVAIVGSIAITASILGAQAIGAGHSFILFLGRGFFPVNVLNAVKFVPEVCRVFCATANPTDVLVAETEQGRGILGVVDGFSPKGVEGDEDIAWRKNFLRQIGYKTA